MSDVVRIERMIDCSCGRRHLRSERCDGSPRGVERTASCHTAQPTDRAHDLDPGHPSHCVVETRWDVTLKKQGRLNDYARQLAEIALDPTPWRARQLAKREARRRRQRRKTRRGWA